MLLAYLFSVPLTWTVSFGGQGLGFVPCCIPSTWNRAWYLPTYGLTNICGTNGYMDGRLGLSAPPLFPQRQVALWKLHPAPSFKQRWPGLPGDLLADLLALPHTCGLPLRSIQNPAL